MRPVPLAELIRRIFSEYRSQKTIFGLQEEHFYRPVGNKKISVFGETCDTPLGPAAGPHTQLTQNIVASYLTGGRFMELKTVQIMDTLEIPKPCIDADDEGFNTEWSTEFTLPKAYDEYVKGWVVLHILEEYFGLKKTEEKSFIFNMSVGYDLDGIKTEKMQTFIHGLIDASTQDLLSNYCDELKLLAKDDDLAELMEGKTNILTDVANKIPNNICRSVTLSTMHGCPPAEIEAICKYMLTEKKLPTFVKLNPTLLGFEKVREILDGLGYDYVKLSRDAFDHDLQYPDALAMLGRLQKLSKEVGVGFGMKLTNTLGNVNEKGSLPGDEMYMSGRALYPLSINLAAKLSEEFKGEIPISFAGGARIQNMKGLFDAGIQPITMATDLLKPGGYTRVRDSLVLLEKEPTWEKSAIDLQVINELAKNSLTMEESTKNWRGFDQIEIKKPLPLFDCYVAPCKHGCPIAQDIPEYVQLVAAGQYPQALDLIYQRNALPAITGYICDHQCQYNCTRLDYEGPVKIREMKKIAVEEGWSQYKSSWKSPLKREGTPTAVIGAGSAGLSAAFFLAREGYPVTIFEKEKDAGGVVANILPKFRIPRRVIEQDINFIKDHGVKFEFNAKDLTIDGLRAQGFDNVLFAVGAEKDNPIPMDNSEGRVTDALKFLKGFMDDPTSNSYGEDIVVIGAGNTAMDSARSAARLPGVKKVYVVYRRTEREMPADKEEYVDALEDGIEFHFLSHPLGFNGRELTLRRMKLGAPDESGRRRPEETDETHTIEVDHMIAAIGEKVDLDMLKTMGFHFKGKKPVVNPENCATEMEGVYLLGDARTGPSSIVAAIAEGRNAVDHILDRAGEAAIADPILQRGNPADVISRKPDILDPAGTGWGDGQDKPAWKSFAEAEGKRCLECNILCNKCVEVCPNRSNIALPLKGFDNAYQILHIDAFCNECGNCGQFCPWAGRPYMDKLTIFNLEQDFNSSENTGFIWDGQGGTLRLGTDLYVLSRDGGKLTARGEGTHDEMNTVLDVIDQVEKDYSYLLGEVLI